MAPVALTVGLRPGSRAHRRGAGAGSCFRRALDAEALGDSAGGQISAFAAALPFPRLAKHAADALGSDAVVGRDSGLGTRHDLMHFFPEARFSYRGLTAPPSVNGILTRYLGDLIA